MNPSSWRELAEIIVQIDGATHVQSQKVSKDCQDMLDIVDEVYRADFNTINQIIDQLKQDPSLNVYTRLFDRKPYISIVLSLAYCKKNQSDLAQKYAQEGKEQFCLFSDKWNRAVAHWFLGIVYRSNHLTGRDKAELEQASEIFSGISKGLSDTTKSRLHYDLADLCSAQLANLRATIYNWTDYRGVDPSAISYNMFSSIVRRLEIPDTDADFQRRNSVYLLQPDQFQQRMELFGYCVEILEHAQPLPEPLTTPLANIFLAHCYVLGDYAGDTDKLPSAIQSIEDAIAIFHSQDQDYNEALAKWYLALIHYKNSNTDAGLTLLYEANTILESLLEGAPSQEAYADLSDVWRNVQIWINPTEHPVSTPPEKTQTSRPVIPSSQPRRREFTTPQVHLSNTESQKSTRDSAPKQQPTSGIPKNRVSRQHIIIPVDVRTLRELNTDSVPLDSSLFASLREYQGRRGPDRTQPSSGADPSPEPPPVRPPRIPSFPILGQVAAGPEGRPHLGSEDQPMVDPVFDDLCTNIDGIQYTINFLEQQQYNFQSGKRYGWFKVSGESMNDFSPVSIKDGDYVLFVENRNLDSCLFKPVVAELWDRDQQPVQLVVKQLLKLSTTLPPRTDGFSPEYSRYVLHSETTLESDPNTGTSYQDIEITRDEQIVGEVIAVATHQ